jgi:hypothetical protein
MSFYFLLFNLTSDPNGKGTSIVKWVIINSEDRGI